jgi:hypothetical protein
MLQYDIVRFCDLNKVGATTNYAGIDIMVNKWWLRLV